MPRDINSKMDALVIRNRPPIPSEGAEGDLTVRETRTGLKLYVKHKNAWEGVSLSQRPFDIDRNGFISSNIPAANTVKFYYDIKVCNFTAASGTTFTLPLAGVVEQTTFTDVNEYVSMVAPYTGYLVRAAFRSEDAQNGNLIFKLYGSTTGTEVPASVRATKTTAINIADDTSVIVDMDRGLDSGSNLMVKGDIFGVELTVPSTPNDCNVTLTFKWDITS